MVIKLSALAQWQLLPMALLMLVSSAVMGQQGEYSELFETLKPGLYIIESVERVSNNKNSVGSGFAVSTDGLIATNYHVVANALLNPEQFTLRYKSIDDDEGALEVVVVDVLYDLALVRMVDSEMVEDTSERQPLLMAFELAEELPAEGDTVLALGNPFDIGLSIVPGTHNGLLERQFRQNIHFTGALNPGMSGGPAVNTEGKVIGINVAGAGNSVSFLVPVAQLAALMEQIPEQPLSLSAQREQIVERIRVHQDEMIDDLIAGDWSLESFGPLMIPREIRAYINCTGNAVDLGSETPWQQSTSNCVMNDRIYLSRRLDTGPLEILFGWYHSDELNPFQFARMFEQGNFLPFNRTADEDVTEFECAEQWVRIEKLAGVPFKASYCVRTYLDYPGLYDVLYVARGMPNDTEGLQVHYTLAGVGRNAASRFHDHLLGVLQWN